jgi:hypothetical protein
MDSRVALQMDSDSDNTTAEQINVVGNLIRYIEHHSVVLARRSAA